mmetsp:Transcript_947/g.1806  ORF Transcript_947/g.1806 Transcript_947/m.1806 type:complete len:205 (+) Transcript_947:572-1186(+)
MLSLCLLTSRSFFSVISLIYMSNPASVFERFSSSTRAASSSFWRLSFSTGAPPLPLRLSSSPLLFSSKILIFAFRASFSVASLEASADAFWRTSSSFFTASSPDRLASSNSCCDFANASFDLANSLSFSASCLLNMDIFSNISSLTLPTACAVESASCSLVERSLSNSDVTDDNLDSNWLSTASFSLALCGLVGAALLVAFSRS